MVSVPGFLLRRLYVKGSLKNAEGGFEFQLKEIGGQGHAALTDARNMLLGMAMQEKKLIGVRPEGMEDTSQLRVDVDREQIANRVGVLGPIEPLEPADARTRIGCGGFVDHRLEGLNELQEGLGGRSLLARGRHHPSPKLEDHPFGGLGLLVRGCDIEALE